MAKNIQAILDWVRENRPDVTTQVEAFVAAEARGAETGRTALFLLTIGFEAGRKFQRENPTVPDGPRAYTEDGTGATKA